MSASDKIIDDTQAADLDAFEAAYKRGFGDNGPAFFERNQFVGQTCYKGHGAIMAYKGWLIGKDAANPTNLIASLLAAAALRTKDHGYHQDEIDGILDTFDGHIKAAQNKEALSFITHLLYEGMAQEIQTRRIG